MNISPDYIIERKNNKAQLRNWKYIVIFLVVIICCLIGWKQSSLTLMNKKLETNYIGSILIEDIIFEDAKRDRKLEKIIKNEGVKALIVHVNSPGVASLP